MWSKAYRYPVSNGVRQVALHLTRHLPSHLLKYLRKKFGPIDIDVDSFHRLQGFVQQLCPTTAECLEQHITLEEVIAAIKSGAWHKTPWSDGICLEFYSANWETVHMDLLELLNQMFLHRNVNPGRNMGSSYASPSRMEITRPTVTALFHS
jgi:hypothetical protein